MMKHAQQDIGAFSQPGKAAIEMLTDLGFGGKDGILQGAFDIAMTKLFRIDFRRIGGQVFLMHIWMIGQVGLHDFCPMDRRAIPNHDDGATNMSAEVLQASDQFFGIDRSIEMPFEDASRDGQTNHGRCLAAVLADAFETGRLAAGRPGEADRFGVGHAKLVFKHDFCAESPRFFLYAANPGAATPGSMLHRVPAPANRAFGRSTPAYAVSD